MYNPNVLAHHGVKGQKWGVIRKRKKDNKLPYRTAVRQHKTALDTKSDYDKPNSMDTKTLVANLKSHKFPENSTITKMHRQWKLTDDDILSTNPDYGKPGTFNNCAMCSMALEVRLRENTAVHAGKMKGYAYTACIGDVWSKKAPSYELTQTELIPYIDKLPPKSSGTISIKWDRNAGHMLHWTKDANNVFEIQDGQNGSRFESFEVLSKEYQVPKKYGVDFTRLDNVELDWENIASDNVLEFDTKKEVM